jgi:hypothetical protein
MMGSSRKEVLGRALVTYDGEIALCHRVSDNFDDIAG